MLRSEDIHSSDWLQPEEANTPKKKSLERISRLFQKKPKKKQPSPTSSLTPSFSTLSLASSLADPSERRRFGSVSSATSSHVGPLPSTSTTQQKNEHKKPPRRSDSLLILKSKPPPPPQHNDQTQADQEFQETDQLPPPPPYESHRVSLFPANPPSRTSSRRSVHYTAPTSPANVTASTPPPNPPSSVAALKAELSRQRQVLEQMEREKEQYQNDSQMLQDRIARINEKTNQRTEDIKSLQQNYDNHLRSMRATDDDLQSIAEKLRTLKQLIRELANELQGHVDPVVATRALSTFWLNLHDQIKRMCEPNLPPHRIRMLTEKFIMDVLVQNLNLNVFPGLEITEPYNQLQSFLETHNPSFAIRLRQELALVVAEKNAKGSDIDQALHNAVQNNWKYLYGGLTKAYPFIYQHDKAEPDVRKHYGAKVQVLVEQAVALGFAIKGQEVDITASDIREGIQRFDPDIMVDEDGLSSGIIEFCICPPFVVITPPYRPLEKGRVLCLKTKQ
ncbi:hypothetical protein EC973_008714 [Apophysomyces ossiformis]|uniref:Uncharacterized protein n=1 Tax=Apophysomyces ossiformis TaxID=679940 RepID=A0A8H7BTA4_9FUNG|nr:hypothetical protein EC973_008714 [Apophysomyces ossiformis]